VFFTLCAEGLRNQALQATGQLDFQLVQHLCTPPTAAVSARVSSTTSATMPPLSATSLRSAATPAA
jgi:hypothetical protein